MLMLHEYCRKADRLADHLPWAAFVAPDVMLNKYGSFQRTLRFRGPDLESATEAERAEALGYPMSDFSDAASWLVDQERRTSLNGEGHRHYENLYHLTLVWMPPADWAASAQRALVKHSDNGESRNWRQALAGFIVETNRVADLFGAFMPEIAALDDKATLTYLTALSRKSTTALLSPKPRYISMRSWPTRRSPAASNLDWVSLICARLPSSAFLISAAPAFSTRSTIRILRIAGPRDS